MELYIWVDGWMDGACGSRFGGGLDGWRGNVFVEWEEVIRLGG